jgi:hypothetical protein
VRSAATTTDTQAPTVVITMPTTNWSYETSNSYVTIGGTASDDTGIAEITWVNDRGGSGTATGTYSWIANVPLKKGNAWNTITVTVRDGAGRVSTDRIWVRRR